MSAQVDRQLLDGIVALQMDFISREQFLEAFALWRHDSATPLGQILRRRGYLDESRHQILQARVQEDLRADSVAVSQPGEGTVAQRTTGYEASAMSTGARPSGELRYQRLRDHAKGGLGEVSVALDTELRREVALKEIQEPFADHPEARTRFIREAEITGNLEHPGIVPVYGLGVHPDGRPYYAMRFIRGRSLHEAIKEYHAGKKEELALRKLLTRFVAVCNAVAFAHARAVIHRDLKPDNVMLGDYGETLVVDWGLARRLAQKDEEGTASGWTPSSSGGDSAPTQQGAALGTPAYMPPEQARGEIEKVGPHSDVWALGAALYHLLTGQAPYTGKEALLRAVACRWQPVRQVKRDVPAALEAICARAMAAEPQMRYATARELAEEVERFLADEPVAAYREPWLDRARRWGRKHRTLATSAVAVLLLSVFALTVGLGAVSAEQARTATALDRAEAAEEQANDNLRVAKQNLRRARTAEKTATDNLSVAEDNLKLAKTAVNETFDVAKNHELLQQPGMHEVRKLLLEKALPFYRRFQIRLKDDRSRAELAAQHHHIGYITAEIGKPSAAYRSYAEAEKHYRALVKSNPAVTQYQKDLASTLNNMGLVLEAQGKRSAALAVYTQAREIREKLMKGNPAVTRYQNVLARTLGNMGNLLQAEGKRSEALKVYTQARDIQEKLVKDNPNVTWYQKDLAGTLNNMGNVLQDEGKRSEALAVYTRARDIREKLVKSNPAVPQYQRDLAGTLNNMGVLLEAEGKGSETLMVYAQARDIGEKLVKDNPAVTEYQYALASTLTNMGLLLQSEGKRSAALAVYTQARGIRETLVKANPAVTDYQNLLAITLTNMGVLLQEEGKRSEALKAFTRARDIREKLVKANPAVTDYQSGLAVTLNNLAALLQAEGKGSAALKVYTQARGIQEKLVKANPTVPQYQNDLAGTLGNMGLLLQSEGKRSAALAVYTQAREILQKLVKDKPAVTGYQKDLAGTLYNLGVLLQSEGKRSAALAVYTQARDIFEKLVKGNPAVTQYQNGLALTLNSLGVLLDEQGKRSDALKVYTQARDIGQKLVKANPAVTEYQNVLASTLANMGTVLQAQGKRSEALKVYTQARDIMEKLVKDNPAVTLYQNYLASTLANMGNVLKAEGKGSEALAVYKRARDIGEKLVKGNPGVTDYQEHLAGTLYSLGNLLRSLKKPAEALEELDRALAHLRAVLKVDPRSASAADLLPWVYSNRAFALTDLKRHAAAAADWGRFVLVAPAQARVFGRIQRASSLAQDGRGEQAMMEAEGLARLPKQTGESLYGLACVASLSAASLGRDVKHPLRRRERLSETYARRAVAWLYAANKVGFFKVEANRQHMAKDADLDSLRQRADFKAFVASLTPKEDK